MYETILVPTDGDTDVDPAVDHALDLARRCAGTIHVLYVVEPPVLAGEIGSPAVGLEGLEEGSERTGERACEAVAATASADGVEAVTAIRRGNPRVDIPEYAREHGVDLIVMATHGRTGLDRVLLGSVTEAVVRRSTVPVLSVRTADA